MNKIKYIKGEETLVSFAQNYCPCFKYYYIRNGKTEELLNRINRIIYHLSNGYLINGKVQKNTIEYWEREIEEIKKYEK